jgi:CheY-like chemotaxis protein
LELIDFVAPDVPPNLRGDPGRLRQILLNLTGNAIKFADKGEVTLRVSVVSRTGESVMLRFEVRDTGPGIAPETQRSLFQPFTQADSSTTRRFGGTGLGLAIAKKMVQMMKGEIGVQSTLGFGATFWFTAQYGLSAPHAAETGASAAVDLQQARVLVYDANVSLREMLAERLASWNAVVEVVGTDLAVIERVQAVQAAGQPFAAVLYGPAGNAEQSERSVRVLSATLQGAATRLLLLTSIRNVLTADALRSAGATDILLKPFKRSRLSQCLSRPAGAVMGTDVDTAPVAKSDSTPPMGSLRVLIAEDNVVNQQVVTGQLRRLGCGADVVANGFEILSAVQRTPYDVILMDCQMPEMDGYEATRQLRRAEEYGSSLSTQPAYIIALTANAMPGDREKCLLCGMNDYLSKPLRMDELKRALRRAVAKIAFAREAAAESQDL